MFAKLAAMHLHITPECLISQVQKEFNTAFPYLKLEFFHNKSRRTSFSASQIVSSLKKIGDIQLVVKDGNISIDGNMKVSELEKILLDEFSLAAQVFRKSGNLWLETTITDSWTLQQQNTHGQEISTGHISYPPDDYDLNRDADN